MRKKTLKGLLFSMAFCAALAVSTACGGGGGGSSKVTLKFDVDGGAAITDVKASKGDEVTLPTPADREGYKFEGWYLTEDFTGSPVTSIVAEESATYYAKWKQLYAITLDANGGSLSKTVVYAESGASVLDAVKDYVPTKSGLTFGAWFTENGKELNKNTKLTTEGITLTAKYKVEYTVSVFVQNINDDDYTLDEDLSYTASDYVGAEVNVETEIDGCTQIEHDGQVVSATLSATKADNNFVVYFDRNEFKLIFNTKTPNGENVKVEKTAKYGAVVDLSEEGISYFTEGYCMVGWSTEAGSNNVEYKTDLNAFIYNVDPNAEEEESESTEIVATRPMVLYGVWQKGATDLYGGTDTLYQFGDSEELYLSRGEFFFKGLYNPETNEFYFYDYSDGITQIVRGMLFADGTFVFADSKRAGSAELYFTYFDETTQMLMGALNGAITIEYDELNTITYTEVTELVDEETGDFVKKVSTGTYVATGAIEYCAEFTTGEWAGKTIHFTIGEATVPDPANPFDTIKKTAFFIRNDEEYNLGKLAISGIYDAGNGNFMVGTNEEVYIELNGYGQATYVTPDGKGAFNYRKDEKGNYLLTNASGADAGTIRASKDVNIPVPVPGYFLYTAALDTVFTLENGGTLTLDGIGNATYEKGSKRFTSYYVSEQMPTGATLITIANKNEGNKVYKFLTTYVEGSLVDTAKEVQTTYAEYYYRDAANVHYAPLLVLDEAAVGTGSVYGYTPNETYEKVFEGTYTQVDGMEGIYQFTITKKYTDAIDGVYNDPVNFHNVNSFVFAYNSQFFSYNVHYWLEMDGVDKCGYYTGENGASLMLVAGFAYYKQTATMEAMVGVYTHGMGYTIVQDAAGLHAYIFYLKDDGTFVELDYLPQVGMPLLQSNNYINNDYYMNLDGMGNATYFYREELEDGTKELKSLNATVVKSGELTEFGTPIYVLTGEEDTSFTFNFIMLQLGEKVYFAKPYEKDPESETSFDYKAGRYKDKNDPSKTYLKIDGYCYKAFYTNGDKAVEGNYYVTDEGVLVFLCTEDGFQVEFDYVSEGLLSSRGKEAGDYVFFKNGDSQNLYCTFDGYGNISVFTLQLVDGEYVRTYVTVEGEEDNKDIYRIIDGGYINVTYTDLEGNVYNHAFENRELQYKAIDKNYYTVLMAEQDLDKDILLDTSTWAVLVLDTFGNAIKYDAVGQKQVGSYTLVTKNVLYFITSDNTDACVYSYDMETGAATPIELKAVTYYNSKLQSLVFSEYGFAIFNGDRENTIFYLYNDNKEAVIYRRAKEGEDVNTDYGFVEENLGVLGDKITYNGDDTYNKVRGTDVRFDRVADNYDLYPILLTNTQNKTTESWTVTKVQFAPGGGVEFSVNGLAEVIIETKNADGETIDTSEPTRINCVVGRDLDEEGNARLYILVQNYFRLYINADYTGSDGRKGENTYTVVGLQYYQYLYSAMYLSDFYTTYMRYGAARANALENEYGSFTLTMDYNEAGEYTNSLAEAEFGEKTEMYDMNGERLTKIEPTQIGSIGSVYYVPVTMSDGYEYRVYFGMSTNPYLNMVGYYTFAFARVQDLKAEYDGKEYTVTVGKTLTTDILGVSINDVLFMSVSTGEGDEAVSTLGKYAMDAGNTLYKVGDVWYAIDRTYAKDDVDKIKAQSSTYYVISVENNNDGKPATEDTKEIYSTYSKVTLHKIVEAEILQEEKDQWRNVEIVDVEGDSIGKVTTLTLHKNVYLATDCTYDAATETYTVTTESKKFEVKKVDDGKYVTITEV